MHSPLDKGGMENRGRLMLRCKKKVEGHELGTVIEFDGGRAKQGFVICEVLAHSWQAQ